MPSPPSLRREVTEERQSQTTAGRTRGKQVRNLPKFSDSNPDVTNLSHPQQDEDKESRDEASDCARRKRLPDSVGRWSMHPRPY